VRLDHDFFSKGDVSGGVFRSLAEGLAFLGADGTIDELQALLEAAPLWTPDEAGADSTVAEGPSIEPNRLTDVGNVERLARLSQEIQKASSIFMPISLKLSPNL